MTTQAPPSNATGSAQSAQSAPAADRPSGKPGSSPNGWTLLQSPLGPVEVDDVSGPRTIVGLGEYCHMCEEPLEPGQIVEFVRTTFGAGVTHERLACVDDVML